MAILEKRSSTVPYYLKCSYYATSSLLSVLGERHFCLFFPFPLRYTYTKLLLGRQRSWKFSTIVRHSSWLVGLIKIFRCSTPDFAQLLMKCTPTTYIASSLYRQVLMKEAFSNETFKVKIFFRDFSMENNAQLNGKLYWQCKEQTYLIVLGGILLALGIWISCKIIKQQENWVGMKIFFRFSENRISCRKQPVAWPCWQLSDQAREVMDYLEQFFRQWIK